MSRRTKIVANSWLPKLPEPREILAAVQRHDEEPSNRYEFGATANRLAQMLRVKGAARLGRGAVQGSWSGTMSASLRLSPRLRSLVRSGLLASYYDTTSYRWRYYLTEAGKRELNNPNATERTP